MNDLQVQEKPSTFLREPLILENKNILSFFLLRFPREFLIAKFLFSSDLFGGGQENVV
jgi:hypothetical protein